MKNRLKRKRSGMALLITTSISIILLVVGLAFLKSFSDSTPVSKAQLNRIQADFFARGIQNLALLKIKLYPDYFVRAYKMEKYKERLENGESSGETLRPFDVPLPDPTPFNSFMNDGTSFGEGGVLINYNQTGFTDPISIASYSTDIKILSTKDFSKNMIEITVYVNTVTGNRNITTPYRITVDANQVIDI